MDISDVQLIYKIKELLGVGEIIFSNTAHTFPIKTERGSLGELRSTFLAEHRNHLKKTKGGSVAAKQTKKETNPFAKISKGYGLLPETQNLSRSLTN